MSVRRGNILMTVLAVMFVMCTLAFGLHWQQSRARSAFLREEAAMQTRLAVEYRLADDNSAAAFTPPSLDVSVSPQTFPNPAYPAKPGSQLFEPGLVDLAKTHPINFDATRKGAANTVWTIYKPNTLNPSLVLGKRRFMFVFSPALPYGALAPQGKVTLDSAVGYANPTFVEAFNKDTTKMYSAAPVRVGARADIKVKAFHYGEAYTLEGTLDIDEGSVIGFRGFLPWTHRGGQDYVTQLDEQIQTAYNSLSTRGQNKTASINGSMPDVGDILGLFLGSNSWEDLFGSALSLRQALSFPFPMIPGGNELGIVTNIWIHMPYPPDGAVSGNADALNSQNDKLQELAKEMEEKQKQLDELEKKIDETPPGAERDALILQRDILKAQMMDLASQADALSKQNMDLMDSATAAGTDQDGPDTRNDEGGLGEDGQFGWAYGPVFKKILDIFAGIFDPESLAETLVHRVRLIHFGPKDNPTTFVVDDTSFHCPATFNVPAGRGFRFNGDMTIDGDLWLQKGSTMMISGNLTLTNPQGAPSEDVLKPQGRVCMEEGATLLVGGNLTVAGSPKTGSVLVDAPVNVVHPATSGILVQGSVNIPYGVFPALTLQGMASVQPLLNGADTVLQIVSSNLAKAAGPFHRRKPFFARYATTFQIVKWPFPPAIIPMCIPLPTPKNVLNPVFSALTTIYQVQLNLVLGENFVTFTDWWFFGKGVVPMVPKIDPKALAGLDGLTLPTGLPSAETIGDFVKDFALKAGTEMITQLVTTVITNLIKSQLGFPLSLVGDFAGDAVAKLTEWVTKAAGAEDLAGTPSLMDLSNLANSIEDRMGEVKPMLAEVPGVLIYSGRDLQVNSAAEVVPLSVGFMVAKEGVTVNSEYLVGAAVSQTGDVTAKNLLYYPEFTRVSLYMAQNNPGVTDTGLGWLDWALEPRYGAEFNSGLSVEVGPPVPHLTVEGWDQ